MKFNENIEEYALDEYSKELFREWDRDIYRHRAERAERVEKEAKRKIKIAEKTSMLKIAKNLISKGMSIEFIEETTGLKKAEITKLIN